MTYKMGGVVRMGRLKYCCDKRRFERSDLNPDLHRPYSLVPDPQMKIMSRHNFFHLFHFLFKCGSMSHYPALRGPVEDGQVL